jgi:hypothetical protein
MKMARSLEAGRTTVASKFFVKALLIYWGSVFERCSGAEVK